MGRIISNSEVEDFVCEMKHYFKHGRNLRARELNDALQIGIAGHDIIATYYQAIKDGKPFPVAAKLALDMLDIGEGLKLPGNVRAILYDRILNYLKYYKNAPWEILEVEKKYEIGFDEDPTFGLRIDLLVRILRGRFTGQIAIVDHKFCYDFWPERKKLAHIQLKKYRWALEQIDIPVKQIILAQIRYRKNAVDKFKHDYLDTNTFEMNSLMQQHFIAADRIEELRSEGLEVWHGKARRALVDSVCKQCDFERICLQERNGAPKEDIDKTLEVYYRQEEVYGYNPREDLLVV